MTTDRYKKCLAGVVDRFSSAKKIPLDPPLTKVDVFWDRLFPLFEKEGLGEIYDDNNRQRIRP